MPRKEMGMRRIWESDAYSRLVYCMYLVPMCLQPGFPLWMQYCQLTIGCNAAAKKETWMNDLCRIWDYQNKRERFLNKGRREKKNSSFFGGCRSLLFPQRIIPLKCHFVGYAWSVTVVEMCTGAVRGQESDWVINQACPSKAWNREVLFLILQTGTSDLTKYIW